MGDLMGLVVVMVAHHTDTCDGIAVVRSVVRQGWPENRGRPTTQQPPWIDK